MPNADHKVKPGHRPRPARLVPRAFGQVRYTGLRGPVQACQGLGSAHLPEASVESTAHVKGEEQSNAQS